MLSKSKKSSSNAPSFVSAKIRQIKHKWYFPSDKILNKDNYWQQMQHTGWISRQLNSTLEQKCMTILQLFLLLRGKDNQYVIRINYRKRICCLWVSKGIAINLWHGSPINEIKSSYPRGLYMRCKFCLGDDLSTSMAETRLPHKWACASG